MYARGMITREISGSSDGDIRLEVSPDLVSTIPDAVLHTVLAESTATHWRFSIRYGSSFRLSTLRLARRVRVPRTFWGFGSRPRKPPSSGCA